MMVETAAVSDIEALVEMRLEYLSEDFGRLDDDQAAALQSGLPRYYREHLNRDLFAYVIREDQAIVSCALLLVVEKPMSPAFMNGKTGIVLNVFTRPTHRRRGYAERILRKLLEDAEAMAVSVIELKATRAGRLLYQKVGFMDDLPRYQPMKWKLQ